MTPIGAGDKCLVKNCYSYSEIYHSDFASGRSAYKVYNIRYENYWLNFNTNDRNISCRINDGNNTKHIQIPFFTPDFTNIAALVDKIKKLLILI